MTAWTGRRARSPLRTMLRSLRQSTSRIRLWLRRYPRAYSVALVAGRALWRISLRRRLGGSHGLKPDRLLQVDPAQIATVVPEHILARRPFRPHLGSIESGDWDRRCTALSGLQIFRSAAERYLENRPWDQTDYYREVMASLEAGQTRLGCRTPEDFRRKCARVDQLYERIASEGYKTQGELGTGRPWDEILVALGRDGEIHFVNGRHRLAIARVLGLPRVPSLVLLRHSAWHRFNAEIRSYVARRGGSSYQPLLHPDLDDIPSTQDHRRFLMIRDALPAATGKLLDIGANWGYFSTQFERLGFSCWAVERSAKEAYFLRRLRAAYKADFQIIESSIFSAPLPQDLTVTLALSIFHHFLKKAESFDELSSFLSRLRTRHLVLETHRDAEPQMRDAEIRMTGPELLDFVSTACRLPSVESLGTASTGRGLYLLSRRDSPPRGSGPAGR